jgi:hypothetical protein
MATKKSDVDAHWLVSEWLGSILVEKPRHRETYELLLYKARTGKTHEQVATDHGMTVDVLKSRVRALKTAYQPEWRRRQSLAAFLFLSGLAVLAVLGWFLRRPAHPPTGHNLEPAMLRTPSQ